MKEWLSPTGSASSLSLMALVLAPILLLDGCALPLAEETAEKSIPRESRAVRENRLQAMWKGRPYNALLETYGSPKLVMSLPGYRQMKTSVVVFGVVDKGSDCVDSFTIESHAQSGEMMVSDYYCR
jgi:hypothetical protein